ncbi:MAG: AAA family ATPase [Nitrospirae bacterium]|nr:AAA family ATPase [Nitrospirota bacterium]MDE3041641.1 AAA family ATPase [Nitrospirota bacterium]
MLDSTPTFAPAVPTSLHELITSLRTALRDEISSRQTPHQGKPLSVPLCDGRVQSRCGRHQRVIFRSPMMPLQGYLDDTQGELVVDGRPHPCIILGLTVDRLMLSLAGELRDEIPQARLTIDRMRLLLALDKRLTSIQAHPQDYLTELAMKCFTPSAVPQQLADQLAVGPDPTLNPEQFEALVRAMTHDFLYLWGPPGTGKTKVIGAVTKLGLQRGDRVLVCSNTNTAVDQALEAVLADADTPKGRIVRYGLAAEDASSHLAPVTLEALAAEELQTLQADLATLQTEAAPLEKEMAQLEQLLKMHEDLIALDVRYAACSQRGLALTAQLAQATEQFTPVQEAVRLLETELTTYWTASRWRRLFLRGANTIQADLFSARLMAEDHQEEIERLTAEQQNAAAASADLLTTRRFLQQSVGQQLKGHSLESLRGSLADRQAQSLTLHQRITSCQRAIASVESRILESAQVVATTITRTYTAAVLERERFDVVIIDEGSMATPPALFAALCLAKRQVIIVGDFLQLPPIAESRTSQAKQWLAKDIYHLAGIKSDQDPRVAALTTQYRMHPDIAALAARPYQRAGLAYRTDTQIRHARQALVEQAPIPGKALAFIDTADAHPWVEKDHKGSPSNHYHAILALTLATQALEGASTAPTVSIIAPYRSQVRLLQELIHQKQLMDRVRVGTIHSFQGQQSDIVIFDTTVTGDLTRTMLGRCDQDQAPCKLINVAFTRGKSKLLVIGHGPSVETLSQTPDSLLWDALQLAKEQGVVFPSSHFVKPARASHAQATPPLPMTPAPTPAPTAPAGKRPPRLYMIRRSEPGRT